MNQEVEWTTNSIFSFINDLQNLPILWDSKMTHQKLGSKNDIWLELATKYNCTSDELKRKWQSLQAAYRREKMKEISSGGQYRSRWFAFNHMSFVGDRYRPRKLIYYSGKPQVFEAREEAKNEEDEEPAFVGSDDPCEEEQEREEEEIEYVDAEGIQQNSESGSVSRTFVTAKANPFKKIKFQYDDLTMRDSYNIQRCSVHQEERNECSIFGEFVAKKLSKLDDRTSAIVQHQIHNILFQAEMGHMNDFITSDLGSPSSVHSPSSTNHHATAYEVHQSQ